MKNQPLSKSLKTWSDWQVEFHGERLPLLVPATFKKISNLKVATLREANKVLKEVQIKA